MELNKFADELIIRIGDYKRHILLPRQVALHEDIQAKLEDHILNITIKGGLNG